MAYVKCPKHGGQIAGVFCEHAASAVELRQPMEFHIQRYLGTQITMCSECAALPTAQQEPDYPVCGDCIREWSEEMANNYTAQAKAEDQGYRLARSDRRED